MEQGAVAPFEWTVEGGEVNFDLPSDGAGNESKGSSAKARL
jgi:hypothetical protein